MAHCARRNADSIHGKEFPFMEQVSDFQRVYDFGNLYAAFLKARKGKRGKPSVAKFEANLLEALSLLSELLKNKTYTMSQYFVFKVYEPKERVVMTNAFKDKVVQHSLCDNVLEPAFSKSFIRDNYASQRGRGTHDGLYRLEEFMRSYYFSRKAQAERESREEGLPRLSPAEYADGWVLKCDVSKYFYSIRHEPLKRMVRRFITDPDVLWLIDLIIDSTPDPGIPIGNQTSQWFAVMYLSGLDHFIKEKLKIKYYGRYMDDFFLIHEDKAYLQYCKKEIEKYVAGLGLSLNNKTNIFPLRNGIDFLGFHTYLTETGKVIRKVRRSSKSNEQKKLKKQRYLLDSGKITLKQVEQSYGSWRSHAEKGNCYHLIREMDELFMNLFPEIYSKESAA
jgi:RNA-directed DNA polymerase